VRKASVEVEFMDVEDRGADTIDLPHTKFSVRRTVNHTGQTQYHINDHSATLEEVTTLLMGKGIDLTNNRFLILQGEVEQISLMKPKSGDPEKPGLIEYLEDIIGSSQFQERIEQLSQDSERLEVMRRERGEIMRIVEGDLARLEPAKDKAIEYVRREKQGMQLQNVQIQVALFKLTSNRDRLALENGKLEDE
jgi:structural maintenance of chromosome 4